MLDVNAYLGRWPFGTSQHETPSSLLRRMDRLGIEQACVAPIEALFSFDMLSVYSDFAKTIKQYRDRLLPFAPINPALPHWPYALDQCLHVFKCAGVRLFPSYHGYEITTPACLELLSVLENQRTAVQVCSVVMDPRIQHPKTVVMPPILTELPRLAQTFPQLQIAVLNVNVLTAGLSHEEIAKCRNLYFDIAFLDGLDCVAQAIKEIGVNHLLYGTNVPWLIPLAALYKLRESALTDEQTHQITRQNALRFLGETG